jgi:hypothetical protein
MGGCLALVISNLRNDMRRRGIQSSEFTITVLSLQVTCLALHRENRDNGSWARRVSATMTIFSRWGRGRRRGCRASKPGHASALHRLEGVLCWQPSRCRRAVCLACSTCHCSQLSLTSAIISAPPFGHALAWSVSRRLPKTLRAFASSLHHHYCPPIAFALFAFTPASSLAVAA